MGTMIQGDDVGVQHFQYRYKVQAVSTTMNSTRRTLHHGKRGLDIKTALMVMRAQMHAYDIAALIILAGNFAQDGLPFRGSMNEPTRWGIVLALPGRSGWEGRRKIQGALVGYEVDMNGRGVLVPEWPGRPSG